MCVCVKGTEPCGIELRLVPSDFIALHRVRGVANRSMLVSTVEPP